MGKSALTRRALATFVARGALVLEGRCHERELVPYKALDALAQAVHKGKQRNPAGGSSVSSGTLPGGSGCRMVKMSTVDTIAAFAAASRASSREPATMNHGGRAAVPPEAGPPMKVSSDLATAAAAASGGSCHSPPDRSTDFAPATMAKTAAIAVAVQQTDAAVAVFDLVNSPRRIVTGFDIGG
jgi:hypothetical protein